MIRLYSGAMSIVLRRILLRFVDISRLPVTMAPNLLRPYLSTSSKTSVDHCYRLHLNLLNEIKFLLQFNGNASNNNNEFPVNLKKKIKKTNKKRANRNGDLPRIFSGSRPRSNPCNFFSSGVFFLADDVLSPGTGLTPFRFFPTSSLPMQLEQINQ